MICHRAISSLLYFALAGLPSLWEQARRVLNPCIMKVSVFESFKNYLWKEYETFCSKCCCCCCSHRTGPFTHTGRFNGVFHELEICIWLVFAVKKNIRELFGNESNKIYIYYQYLCFFGFYFRRDLCLARPAGGALDQDVAHSWSEDAFQ